MKRTLLRVFLTGFSVALMSSGCSETVPVASTAPRPAPSTDVGKMQAWKDAERISANDEGRVTLIGSGESMRPIYGENTVLVISKIDFADLKPGMQVAYNNQAGRRVVHVLLDRDDRGWRVQGLNNASEDRERVTRHNLIGVVYASFATEDALK